MNGRGQNDGKNIDLGQHSDEKNTGNDLVIAFSLWPRKDGMLGMDILVDEKHE